MLDLVVALVIAAIAVQLAAHLFLKGPNLDQFDQPRGQRASARNCASAENDIALEIVKNLHFEVGAARHRDRIRAIRRVFDKGIPGAANEPGDLGVRTVAADADGVPAEWVVATGNDNTHRLLYIHGGAFIAGSPKSHRAVTARLSRLAGIAVLAIDYRLMPEHSRIASLLDCQTAYRWLIANGPNGPSDATRVLVAGDSAGGNLTLSLIAWVRDNGLRQADAAIALSPLTDSTLSSPSWRSNVQSDAMLGPKFGPLNRIPTTLVLLGLLLAGKVRPANPLVSPVFGNLSKLPPTLVHASESEMLFDDACRWVNKARSEGTDAQLATWPQMLHVWHLFADIIPEANEALEHIAEFVIAHTAVTDCSNTAHPGRRIKPKK